VGDRCDVLTASAVSLPSLILLSAAPSATKKKSIRPSLRERSSRLPSYRPSEDKEAEPVHERVAKHVQGISEQRRGMGEDSRGALGQEHDSIDDQHDPQHTPVARRKCVQFAGLIFAVVRHLAQTTLSGASAQG
jgi:hypothetical protein